MALDARTRSSIYDSLVPVIGADNANALMSEFPSVEADELVTKQFLRAELSEGLGSLRTEMVEGFGSLRTEMARMENRLTLRLGAGLSVMTAVLAALITLG
jgi:hypothetical protein